MRLAPLLAALAALLALAGTARAAPTPVHGDFAGRVDIGGGRHLYLECRGRGTPVVVLEAGLRSRGDFWTQRLDDTPPTTVLPGVARFTRVCAYDRPGTTLGTDDLSRSDPVPMPRSARSAARDLHALLQAAHLPGPYVLAGHSTGGLIIRLFAAAHPHDVAGLVLVDALSEFLQDGMTPEQFTVFDDLNNGPLPGLESYTDLEAIPFGRAFEQMRRAAARHPLRGVPLTVISRGRSQEVPDGLPAGLTTAVLDDAWRRSQHALATLEPRARHVVAARSSHYIMFSQPGLIIHAIREMVRR